MRKIFYLISIIALFFVILPLFNILTKPSISDLFSAITDREVLSSIELSLLSSVIAGIICIIIGTPLSYIFARKEFPFKRILEGIIDLPIMIPHPVIGLAILTVVAKDYWIGKILSKLAINVIGSSTGIVIVLTYVALPYYINTVKTGINSVPERLEFVSRTLGKNFFKTFISVTLPLTYKSIIEGMIMSIARAISEFGAVIIIAYHPMVAPVLIYERFTAYGLKYSIPVAVWLMIVSLTLFVVLRFFSRKTE